MDETPEIPQKEQVVTSPELAERISHAQAEILAQGQNPEAVVGRNIAEMGFMQALWETAKPHTKKLREINFKNLKAQGAALLSLIPVIGQGKAFLSTVGVVKGYEAGAKAYKAEKGWRKVKAIGAGFGRAMAENAPELAKAGSLFEKARAGSMVGYLEKEGALRAERIAASIAHGTYESSKDAAKALKAGLSWNKEVAKKAVAEGLDLAADAAGKTGVGRWAFKQIEKRKIPTMNILSNPEKRAGIGAFLDLTPDVPGWLSLTTAVGEVVGIHGIDVIPAALQMGKNTVDYVKTYSALTNDVLNLAIDRVTGRGKGVAKAAQLFSSYSASPQGV